MRLAGLIVVFGLATGCGYVGDPLPPALNIPKPVQDLQAIQVGGRVEIRFTIPAKTTEELAVRSLGGVELRVGTAPAGDWNLDAWAATARVVEVAAREPGAVDASSPVGDLAGSDVVLAVRLRNAKGRVSAWSNFVRMRLERPVETPAFTASSAPDGALLTWAGFTGKVIVFRDGVRIGAGGQGRFEDARAELGKAYAYEIQASVGTALGERMGPVRLTVEDRFPPAKPTGLNAVPGVGAVELNWNRNLEADVANYVVLRGGVVIGTVDVPAFTDREAKSGQSYKYQVKAVDLRNNQSAASDEVEIMVP